MFQNLVALPHPVGLATEETCNALPLQKRHLLPAGAYLLGGWMEGRESWKKVLLGGGKSLELIASLHAVSLLKRLLAGVQGAVPFKRDFSMSSAKRYPVPNCFFASLSRLPSSELVCWLPLSCPVAQPLGAKHPPRRAPSGVEECECH